jgi:hypothetical protein
MYGDVGRDSGFAKAKDADCAWLRSDICRDILFSERELCTERAEYSGLGDADEGGVKVGLSRRAKDSCNSYQYDPVLSNKSADLPYS